MTHPQQSKKIPGILGLIVLIVGVVITVYITGKTTNFFGHAAPSENPQNVRITNVTDTSFTVTYQTDAAYIGTVALGNTNDTQTILDDRDQSSGSPKPYIMHSITLRNLQANTTYAFSILSGSTTFLHNGAKFSVTTGNTVITNPSSQTPLAGKIISSVPNTEILVFATVSDGQTLSTLTDSSGNYILPLNTMRSKDLSSYLLLNPQTQIQILAVSQDQQAHATISLSATNPVPAIALGEDYDFTQSTIPIASSSAFGGFPAFALDESLKATPQILSPAKDNEGFTDAQPLFKGTAPPGAEVTITIHSVEVVTTKVLADANGNWSYRPSTPLSPGQHTITITTTNKTGILQTIQKSFTVFAAGSQVTQSATPSATLAPATPTPTSKPKATPTPTPKIINGAKVTLAPTITPTNTPTVMPTATTAPKASVTPPPKLPPTGSNDTIIFGTVGIATTVLGMMIFFLTKGAAL